MMSIQYLYNELADLGLDVINSIPLTLILFSMLGLIVVKRSLINVIIALEILLLASSFQAIIASISHDDVVGTIFAIFILSIAAAESAIGLALFIVYFRLRGLIFIDLIDYLKG